MGNEYLGQNKSVFHRKRENPYKKYALIILLLFIAGFIIDGVYSNFYIVRNAKSFGWAFVGILILSILYLIGEIGSEWIGSKDKVSNPLYKRAYHLLLLLCFVGLLATVFIFIFKYLGWKI